MTPLKIFIGYDHRQPMSLTALMHSLIKYSTKPLQITPLVLPTLPLNRVGLTPFTYSRFLVPYLCGFEGKALFMDMDMLALGDISELFDLMDDSEVMVSKNDLRFEWSSLMLFNCEKCSVLTPDFIQTTDKLHGLEWANSIGSLPGEWNHLVGYDQPKPAKIVHYTQGVPLFPETKGCEYSDEWWKLSTEATSALSWVELMGRSVHAKPVLERLSLTT